ncbi:MAG: RluA family pseudouridine synthase [Clostridia bacterium]|nr:RluA family pseudouridine synthase [Clostridia bacterium]
MASYKFIIENKHDGFQIKEYLKKVASVSSRQIKKLKAYPDGILLNGEHAIVIDVLHENDILEINSHDDVKQYDYSGTVPDIVFEDENYLVVNKPYNMTVYLCGDVKENLLSSVCGFYHEKGIDFVFRPFYRLDKDTSGLVIIAKNALIMNSTEIEKDYYAVCEGEVPSHGMIDTRIGLMEGSRIRREAGEKGETALTEYTTLGFDGANSLVKLKIYTGRTHQIRVHMSSIGYPLCGDDLYDGHMDIIPRQALHCKTVTIRNKLINYEKTIDTDFPDDIRNAFPKLCT